MRQRSTTCKQQPVTHRQTSAADDDVVVGVSQRRVGHAVQRDGLRLRWLHKVTLTTCTFCLVLQRRTSRTTAARRQATKHVTAGAVAHAGATSTTALDAAHAATKPQHKVGEIGATATTAASAAATHTTHGRRGHLRRRPVQTPRATAPQYSQAPARRQLHAYTSVRAATSRCATADG
jgi:hypothetical protein